MPITSNVGGVLHELDVVTSNAGGVLHELDIVHSNVGGVLKEIHRTALAAEWTSYGDNVATIVSTSNDKHSTTVTYKVNTVTPNTPPNTVKCTFNIKAGQTLHAAGKIEGGVVPRTKVAYLYSSDGAVLANWNNQESDVYTATGNLKDCYMIFGAATLSSSGTALHTITLTIIN